MEILRTPEGRFNNLPGFPYAPRFIDALPGYSGFRTPATSCRNGARKSRVPHLRPLLSRQS
jgi:hypothetical protein